MRRYKYVILLILLIIFINFIGNLILNFDGIHKTNLNVYKKLKTSNFIVHIEVDNKALYLIDKETKEIIEEYIIATGKSNSPTPLGTFEVTDMGKWGEGFGSRWIGLNVPWGRYGIHGTNKPGSIGFNASAGCVRMRNSNIESLYDKVSIGTAVIITNGPYGPFAYGYRDLKPGHRGADVLEVQKRLYYFGYYNDSIDGIYGEGMKSGLVNFLKDNNMDLTDTITKEVYESLGIMLIE